MGKHDDDWRGEHLIRTVKRETKAISARSMQGNGYANMPRLFFGRGAVQPHMAEAVKERRDKVRELFDAGLSSMAIINGIEGMTESILRSDLHEMGLKFRERANVAKR